MSERVIGHYLARHVRVEDRTLLSKRLSRDHLAAEVVFFWLQTSEDLSSFVAMIESLIDSFPVAIFTAGPWSDQALGTLLHALSVAESKPTIMTKAHPGDMADAIEDLFYATWPSEDRFDDWTGYVLVAGDEERARLTNLATGFLRGSADP
jgi:hypothetical protein